jgi:acetate kinase
LVFTAGIGEGSSWVREQVCGRLGFLGVRLDADANRDARPDVDVAAADSPARVWVVHTREDVIAARAARAVL